jgi:uncharacterized membrane protein YdbT with pleckstrin-like domain
MTNRLPTSLHHIHGSLFLLVLRVFFISFLFDSIYGGGLFFLFYSSLDPSYEPYVFAALSIVHSAKFILQTSILLFLIIRWSTRIYYIKEHQIVIKRGLIRTEEDSYELAHVRKVHLKQNIFGKIFNYGDVHVMIASSGFSEEVKLREITNPKKYEWILRDYIEKLASEEKKLRSDSSTQT